MLRLALITALGGLLVGLPAVGDDPPKKLSPEERKELEAKREVLNATGYKAFQAGKYQEAQKAVEEALTVTRQLYPRSEFPDGHANLATSLGILSALCSAQGKYADAEILCRESLDACNRLFKGDHASIASNLNNLAYLLQDQGKYAEAELLSRDSLAMRQRLFNGDHLDVAISQTNLASSLKNQGKYAEAEPLYRDSLAMRKRLFKGDHPAVAISLNNLAGVYHDQEKYPDAETLYKDALEMYKRLFKGDDHPAVATGLDNLAMLYQDQDHHGRAEPLYRDALEMRKRLFQGDHLDVAISLNNLARLLNDQRKYADAERLFRQSHEMQKRVFNGDHPKLALGLNNLALLYCAQSKYAEAEPIYRDALAMSRRLLEVYAKQKSEGDTLTLAASQPLYRDSYLSNSLLLKSNPGAIYHEIWGSKAAVSRAYEQRQQATRAVATNPVAAKMLTELADLRRRRAERLLTPQARGVITNQTHAEIKDFEQRIAELDRAVRPLLPTIEQAEKLAKAAPADLQKLLPTEVAVVDFLRFSFTAFENDKAGEKRTERYLAFVVTKDRIAWIDLETANKIEDAVAVWRDAITSGKNIPAAIPAKARELVWEKVRKELPANIKTVYIAPDLSLCRVPWGALPGDKPGTILLEDFAIATIPHAPFLLDKLWPRDAIKNPPSGSLVVGGVDYEAEATTGPANRDLPVKPGAKAAWPALPGAATEATGVASVATAKKLAVTSLKGESATPAAVLAALPKAKYAHFATHGFFADASFRSAFQLDEKDFQRTMRGERIGRAALSPLVMTGLVFAGANNPKTPGRGIVTGEALVDLDLSGLELAVLSACETGLGDVAGGEGTFGLQRAFHLAGTRDVVASLWKVPDAPTAALMAEFYRNLWTQNLSPLESLRQAQLTIYRNPGKIAELAAGFRAGFKEVKAKSDEIDIKPTADGKTPTHMWAAFTLSGIGR